MNTYISPNSDLYLVDNRRQRDPSSSTEWKHFSQRMTSNDGEEYTEVDEDTGERFIVDDAYLDEESLQQYHHAPIGSIDCFDVEFLSNGVTLLVGGDRQGISDCALKLVFDRGGQRWSLPVCSDRDKLSPAVSASVAMFNFKRQFLLQQQKFQEESY